MDHAHGFPDRREPGLHQLGELESDLAQLNAAS
jgi:hypothetical protein